VIVIDGNIHLCGCEFIAQHRDVAPLFVVEGIVDTHARVTREHWSVTMTPGGSDDSFDEYGVHLYQIPARCGCGCPKPRQQVFVAVLSPRRRNCRLGPTFSDRPAASPRARSVAARPRPHAGRGWRRGRRATESWSISFSVIKSWNRSERRDAVLKCCPIGSSPAQAWQAYFGAICHETAEISLVRDESSSHGSRSASQGAVADTAITGASLRANPSLRRPWDHR
jgi:hypothetical protein